MAPTSDSIEGHVMTYMIEQNRPLNVQMVADALQKFGAKKTAVQKALDAFACNGELKFKEYGKQRIYLVNQERFQIVSAEELEGMKKEVEVLQQALKMDEQECYSIESEIRSSSVNLSKDEIDASIIRLTNQNESMEKKLSTLRSGTVLVPLEKRKEIESIYDKNCAMWKKRKRMFKELWSVITENLPKKLTDLKEELGIESDEDAGIRMEDYCNLSIKKFKQNS